MVLVCLSPLLAAAQDHPAKPVRLVVGFPAGGGSDIIARLVAQKRCGAVGQPVVLENRPGASDNIAAEIVARSPADGYALLFGNSSPSIGPAVLRKLNYDPVKDLVPVSMSIRHDKKEGSDDARQHGARR